MQLWTKGLVLAVGGWFALAGAAFAETKVTMSETHLCCGGCVNGVKKALGKVEGISFVCSQDDGSVAITASDDKSAQLALDTLVDAGCYGKIDNKSLKLKQPEAPAGNVKRVEVIGVHNCCGACTRDIKGAIKSVKGVSGDTAKPKVESFVVEGDFSPADLLKALYDAGFSAKLK